MSKKTHLNVLLIGTFLLSFVSTIEANGCEVKIRGSNHKISPSWFNAYGIPDGKKKWKECQIDDLLSKHSFSEALVYKEPFSSKEVSIEDTVLLTVDYNVSGCNADYSFSENQTILIGESINSENQKKRVYAIRNATNFQSTDWTIVTQRWNSPITGSLQISKEELTPTPVPQPKPTPSVPLKPTPPLPGIPELK